MSLSSVSQAQEALTKSERGACRLSFTTAKEEISQKVIKNKPLFIKSYKGQDGYLRFVEELSNSDGMNYVFNSVSKILNKNQMKELGWQQYQGSLSEYRKLRAKILDRDGVVRPEYRGMEGYALFAEREFSGEMLKTYKNVSAILDTKEMKELDWQQYQGRVSEYRKLRVKILDQNGRLRPEYIGMEGYALFAEREFSGEMLKTYRNVSAILDKKQMKELGWQQYHGSLSEYRKLRAKILDRDGVVRPEYRGMEGYALFAEREFSGEMLKTYKNVSAILDTKQMKELGWQGYQGRVPEYRKLRAKILDQNGGLRPEHIGMEGYALFAEREFSGEMQKTYKNVSAILDKKQMKELGWQKYQGSLSDYRKLRAKILDQNGVVRPEYRGMEGYALFAEQEFSGEMQKTYNNVSAILDTKQMKELGWQAYFGRVSEYRELRAKILNQNGGLRPEYIGMEGYALFAEREFSGEMLKTYVNVSAILNKKQMKVLGWQGYKGRVSEYRKLRAKILDQRGRLRPEYRGMEGYALFAEREFSGEMLKTYINVSAVLDKKQMKELGWQAYHGRVPEYRKLRAKILDQNGVVRPEYRGMEGYALFAEQEFSGEMLKTYQNVSAILDTKQMKELDWQQYQGSLSEYRKLRTKILDQNGGLRPEYRGMEGYALFAEQEFSGDMKKTYANVSAILNKNQMKELDWQAYHGRVPEYRKLRTKILDQKGKLRPEYIGMEGYVLFAEREFSGEMQKTYVNVSAVLGGIKEIRELGLGWKSFQGNVLQFYALKELFDTYGVKELKGLDGQGKVAREIFDGNRRKAYQNVSVLREELLGSRKAFNELKWLLTSK